jgi:hypothetical protein
MLVLLGTCWIPGGQSAWLVKGCLLGCLYPLIPPGMFGIMVKLP